MRNYSDLRLFLHVETLHFWVALADAPCTPWSNTLSRHLKEGAAVAHVALQRGTGGEVARPEPDAMFHRVNGFGDVLMSRDGNRKPSQTRCL